MEIPGPCHEASRMSLPAMNDETSNRGDMED